MIDVSVEFFLITHKGHPITIWKIKEAFIFMLYAIHRDEMQNDTLLVLKKVILF